MNTLCPVCGSDALTTSIKKHALTVIYGKPAEYNEVVDTCSVCEESGDFSDLNDATINQIMKAAKKESATNMLDYLSNHNIKMSYMERSLELPARTLARWKAEDCSAAGLALLRIIRTYPWILEVADDRFSQPTASSRLVEEAGHVLKHALPRKVERTELNVLHNNNTLQVNIQFSSDITSFPDKALEPAFEQMIEGNV